MTINEWVNDSFDRAGDYALVTGASSGIGLEYLKALVALGCPCIATSENENELSRECSRLRQKALTPIVECVSDLSSTAGVERLLTDIEGLNVAILINNAGIGIKGAFTEHPPDQYAGLVALNAVAPTLICRHVLPQMIEKRRGLVMHVASINAITPIAYNAVYTASKAYLLYYAYAVAYELRHTPIRFQIVLPGTTDTAFHKRQGAVPRAMFMSPDTVVRRSFQRIDRLLCVTNKLDRILFPLVLSLPLGLRTAIGTYLLKKRLSFKEGHQEVPSDDKRLAQEASNSRQVAP